MTKTQLKALLEKNGQDMVEGYNYTMLCIRVPAAEVANTVTVLRRNKARIEREYAKYMKGCAMYTKGVGSSSAKRIKLLPCVCLPRERSVLVPVPCGCAVNMVSSTIGAVPGLCEKASLPVWG